MKFLPLIFRNVLRNKIRSLFTGASIAVSLFLVVMLYSFLSVQDEMNEKNKVYNRIIAQNVRGLTADVPIAYVDRIRELDGVLAATPFSWYGGNYKDEKIQFAQFGVDPESLREVFPDMTVPEDQFQAWSDDKTGCLVGEVIARNKGWKIGDKIVLKGNIYPANLELTVRGIYAGKGVDLEWLLFHFDYMDEALKKLNSPQAGNAGLVFLRAKSAGAIGELTKRIDREFASSDAPVRAMTEKQFQESFGEMMGNVKGFIRYTSLAVVAALLCVAANTMGMSLRERTREIALLKAIGFTQPVVLAMVLAEATLIGLLGGAVGALGGKLLFAAVDFSRFVPGLSWLYVPWPTALSAVGLAAAIGLASGIIPAWRAANLSVLEGLRKVV